LAAHGGRKRTALYPQLIEAALRQHEQLPLRAEQHGNYGDLFVDTHQLELLRNPDWQVIFGRRGTGKTFLLGMLAEEGKRARDVLTINLTAQDFLVSPVSARVSDHVRAHAYFQTFLELMLGKLAGAVESWIRAQRVTKARAVARMEDLVLELLQLAEDGRPVRAFDSVEWTSTDSEDSHKRRGRDIDARIDIGSNRLGGRITGGFGRGSGSSADSERSRIRRGEPVPRYGEVRQKLGDVVELLDFAQVNIQIDEWSVLDDSATTAIQPEFAELLKRTLAGIPRVSVKIATNRYQTRLNNRGSSERYRGLEVDADIFVATNLDRALHGIDDLSSFYETLLFRRMRHVERGLAVFDPYQQDQPDPEFLLAMFRDRSAFEQLVKGAEGNPRDFLLMFKRLARYVSYKLDSPWTTATVMQIVRESSIEGQDEIEYESVANTLLTGAVKEVVTTTRSRFFAVIRDDFGRFEDALDELLEKRLIHEFPREDLPPETRDRFRGYLVDYGLWLDWERAVATAAGVTEPAEEALPDLSLNGMNAHVIDPSAVDTTSLIVCIECEALFPEHARSYQLEKLCPECFRPAHRDGDADGNSTK